MAVRDLMALQDQTAVHDRMVDRDQMEVRIPRDMACDPFLVAGPEEAEVPVVPEVAEPGVAEPKVAVVEMAGVLGVARLVVDWMPRTQLRSMRRYQLAQRVAVGEGHEMVPKGCFRLRSAGYRATRSACRIWTSWAGRP